MLTDYLELSVGGTLAVGGVGATSIEPGVQSDHVLELEVVTGEGRAVAARLPATPISSTLSEPVSGRSP